MLLTLRVRDLAVLEDVEVSFGDSLTILTGETGAGKSLVVDALSLLSGERADASLVRAGAERLVVEGAFESDDGSVLAVLRNGGLATETEGEEAVSTSESRQPFEIVIRREVAPGGKGRLFINGSPATLKTLLEIAPRLLVLYGQAEARDLLDPAAPRELLDRFAGLEAQSQRTVVLFTTFVSREDERLRIASAGKDRTQRLELLDFQLREIGAVGPRPGEETELSREKALLASAEKRGQLLSTAVSAFESEDGGGLSAIGAARKACQALAELDPSYEKLLSEVTELLEKVSDLVAMTSRDLERLQHDPGRLTQIAERLDALARLKRKYGPTDVDVLAHQAALEHERDELSDLEGAERRASEASREAFEAYRRAALELSAARAAASSRLSKAVEAQLKDLAFQKASFSVVLSRRSAGSGSLISSSLKPSTPFEAGGERIGFGASGIDQVSFSFAPNRGEPARPLQKIASGGELSRVQLALAAALAEEETRNEAARKEGARTEGSGPVTRARSARRGGPVRTFVFDEVDAGVSGAVAAAVGEKLRTLARREQILVVTHLPQVAAFGDHHLAVSKETGGGRTRTSVAPLDDKGRVEAIAALLAGASVAEPARAQARQLLKACASGRTGRP